MSSKGQIVIPKSIRNDLKMDEGSLFEVIETENGVILHRINRPSKEELLAKLDRLAEEGSKLAAKLGIKESDVQKIIERRRKFDRLL